ncbi:MAG: hypothetical protein ACXW1M_04440 [Acidimicrobiia bacterium]
MTTRHAPLVSRFVVVIAAVALFAAGCGSDDDDTSSGSTSTTGASTEPVQNACPVDGCQITIDDVTRDGEELEITWTANFDPDVSRNHIHVYWDTYDPAQVSNDAESTHGVTQGEWVPTDSYPSFTSEGAVAVGQRGTSTTVCVTAGDKDHNVIDVGVENCRDVAAIL